ncbi:hypothetical protein BDN70DRAFT_924897 [Pholiota conissans]|uniref:Uncharacterized protein n=1 Tax=Pholiota conissans TaxID=109636 RepID=A0A9P5YQD3_9AGAR|nr:hypothetical protein BDN70DRAFT_924897 [Pholiota conissans]
MFQVGFSIYDISGRMKTGTPIFLFLTEGDMCSILLTFSPNLSVCRSEVGGNPCGFFPVLFAGVGSPRNVSVLLDIRESLLRFKSLKMVKLERTQEGVKIAIVIASTSHILSGGASGFKSLSSSDDFAQSLFHKAGKTYASCQQLHQDEL